MQNAIMTPSATLLIEGNYEDFHDFYKENKLKIYRAIIELFRHFDNQNVDCLTLKVDAKISDLNWDSIFNFKLQDSIVLTRYLLPTFVEFELYEECAAILSLYETLQKRIIS